MPEPQSPRLEAGDRTLLRSLGETTGPCLVDELRLGVEHCLHRVGIVFPIGGEAKTPAWPQSAHEHRDEPGFDQAPLVVSLLRPGIREIDHGQGERARGQDRVDQVPRVAFEDPDVGGAGPPQGRHQCTDARPIDLGADAVHLRMGTGIGEQAMTHPESDFEHQRRSAAEGVLCIERCTG